MSARYQEFAPPPGLAPWVECVWCSESSADVPEHSVRPDGCLDILFSSLEGLNAVGAMTIERRIHMPPGVRTAGIRFHPGMAGPFLNCAPDELTDRIVSLDIVWGAQAREWEARLATALKAQELAWQLGSLFRVPAGQPGAVRKAISAIRVHRGNIDLDWVASQANLSPRQFRRRCLEESGLNPKRLCRILRFRHASELAAAAPKPDWADLATRAGYFDQAHLIRDFREFTGRTPGQTPGSTKMSVFSNPAGNTFA